MRDKASKRLVIILLFLAVATAAVYLRTTGFEFLNYDDDDYVTENRFVQRGLTGESIKWAFGSEEASNWHPLTWLSLMLDYQLFGLNSGAFHLVNLLFHIANSMLLFLMLNRCCKAVWASAFVAAAFALHPLHVESVAWIAERKDVLSTFFWILTMLAYADYVRGGGIGRYFLALFWFVLGLTAKPMLVTLPCVLLLWDYWPLRRIKFRRYSPRGRERLSELPVGNPRPLFRLVLEKIPFFVLAAVSSVVTIIAQRSGGSMGTLEAFPLKLRIPNALCSYVGYIEKMLWPRGLAIFYPHPEHVPDLLQITIAVVVLLGISALVIFVGRKKPYLVVGWLWYIGTLVPVIGLVQVGRQSMADRYTYIPLIGLFMMVSWLARDFIAKRPYRKTIAAIVASGVLVTLMICTYVQLGHWRNSFSLFTHALTVTSRNYTAHNNLGRVLADRGDHDQAMYHFTSALKIKPEHVNAHNNLGFSLLAKGRLDEAIVQFRQALELDPDFAEGYYNLGNALTAQRKPEDAIRAYRRALQIKSDFAKAHFNLAIVLNTQGEFKQAAEHYQSALEISPDYVKALVNLAMLFAICPDAEVRNGPRAIELARRAAELTNYCHAMVMATLATAYAEAGRFDEAVETAEKALQLALAANQQRLTNEIQKHLASYKTGRSWCPAPAAAGNGAPSK